MISEKQIEESIFCDVVTGRAGTMLSLLTMHSYFEDALFLERAILCGEMILKNAIQSDSTSCWKSIENTPLTGFSHGASGIAYALLRLFEATGDRNYRETAEKAIAFERSVFSADAQNWPDLRRLSQYRGGAGFMTRWCHGATGIALARLGALPIMDTPEIREEIGIGIHATQEFPMDGVDDLCCGNAGRIDVLLTAGVEGVAREKASWMIDRASRQNGFVLGKFSLADGLHSAMFKGTAGIGYTFLRLLDQNSRLPSVLLIT